MEFSKRYVSVAMTLISFALSANAQSDSIEVAASRPASIVDLNDGVHFEVSPHTGVMGGSGIFGVQLGMNYSSLSLELSGEQVIGKTANLYPISLNALVNLSTRGRLIPFGSVGAGLLLAVPTSTIGDETVSSIGFNFGGGARYFLTSVFGLRAEARQYITSIKNERDSRNELLVFQEFSIGVSFLFR